MAKLTKPVSLAPVKALAAKETAAVQAKPVVKDMPPAKVVETKAPAVPSAVVTASGVTDPVVSAPAAAAAVAAPAPLAAAAAEPKPEAAKIVATKAPEKTKTPSKALKKVAVKPAAAKGEVAKPEPVKAPEPVSVPAPVEAKTEAPVGKVSPRLTVVAATPKAPKAAEIKAAASFAFPEISLSSPAFGQELASVWFGQIARAGRTLAEVQARLLDHGVHELKAGLGEVEAIARAGTPSEVVLLQAKAFRRSADALVDTVSEVSAVARKSMIAR